MKIKFLKIAFVLFLLITFFQCNKPSQKKKAQSTVKFQSNDPFKNTIVPSQIFDIEGREDQVIEGESGTVVVFPKGCFKNLKGEIVEGNIKIELAEALSLKDMLLSNLTTTSNKKLLETGGMIYLNATSNGEQLTINKDNPIHIEIPTTEKKASMMAYKGNRDEKGNMNWVEPKVLNNYLVTLDINSLDFLPQSFQTEVDKGMPYKKYKLATQALTDSLYYMLSVIDGSGLLRGTIPTNYNEPYYNKGKKITNGKYTDESYLVDSFDIRFDTIREEKKDVKLNCGIDPAIIKVIKSEKYQNTFIATREFEARLKVIFKTCNNAVLETYINNLDKNLYEVDSMAANVIKESPLYQDFVNFSKQRLTKVKQADKYAELLTGYYKKQLAKVKSELEKNHERLLKELQKKNKEAEKVAEDYKKLLWKREKHRMETYGFNWTETGWINIDNGTLPKEWSEQPLEIIVVNGKQFDRVYTYVVYTSIKSLYRLNATDNEQFYAGNDDNKQMLMPNNKLAIAIAIGYKGENVSLSIKEFQTIAEPKFSLTLASSSIGKVKEAIKPYEKYGKENKISKDLEFMAKFYEEEQRQKELKKESEFILRLWKTAFPCCEKIELLKKVDIESD